MLKNSKEAYIYKFLIGGDKVVYKTHEDLYEYHQGDYEYNLEYRAAVNYLAYNLQNLEVFESVGEILEAQAREAKHSVSKWHLAKWYVNVKGQAGKDCFQISIVRDDNTHGKKSGGWFNDDEKLLISSYTYAHLTTRVWDKMIKLAQETADELNALECNDF
tara:strand:+ start:253 stop:735 length:483 start_codon:yes stop_codon:yes gene_type:complete